MGTWTYGGGRVQLPACGRVAQLLIRLERPALLTPELRAWIHSRFGLGRAVLMRSRLSSSERAAMLLRVEVQADSDDQIDEEVEDLLTDLRLLGLRPTLVSEQAA
jgi:hypothetical protein